MGRFDWPKALPAWHQRGCLTRVGEQLLDTMPNNGMHQTAASRLQVMPLNVRRQQS
jgi:hypothetical protein